MLQLVFCNFFQFLPFFGFNESLCYPQSNQSHLFNQIVLREDAQVQETQQLVEWLMKGGYGREVVSVAAMGGMGKTTLATQVYDDKVVKKHFKRRAWITVSQSFNTEELLKDMIRQISSVGSKRVSEGLDSMKNYKLRRTTKDLLQRKRYLIVLDDVFVIDPTESRQLLGKTS